MPKAALPRGVKPLGDRSGGLRIFTQQKAAHRGIGDVGFVQKIKQLAGDRVGRFREVGETVDGFRKFGCAARLWCWSRRTMDEKTNQAEGRGPSIGAVQGRG